MPYFQPEDLIFFFGDYTKLKKQNKSLVCLPRDMRIVHSEREMALARALKSGTEGIFQVHSNVDRPKSLHLQLQGRFIS